MIIFLCSSTNAYRGTVVHTRKQFFFLDTKLIADFSGIDYILQKLGFSHARTTIPKWLQRGFMDPIDAILAVLTLRVVHIVKGDQTGKEERKAVENKK